MEKFTREEKIEMIREYHEEKKSIAQISAEHGISQSYLRMLLSQYEKEGTDNIGLGQKDKPHGRYPGQFKLDVVKERIENSMSYHASARKYNLNHYVIMTWERKYLQEGEQGLLEDRRSLGLNTKESNHAGGPQRKYNKKIEEDLIAEVQRLRMENDYLKKLNALIQDGRKSQPFVKRK